jgi:L-ascorbate metabolism protein UlaG (beta-lactamase superfamily)
VWTFSAIILFLAAAVIIFVNQPSFGRLPRGERLEKIQNSPNYKEGKFQNISPTAQITSNKSKISSALDFMFRKTEGLRPKADLPTIKTNLKQFKHNENVMVWLGHSSVFIQINDKRFLIDPALITASPISFLNKPFKGTDIYNIDDIPYIDYLIITHDHWDHLDYETIKQLKNRVGKVICPLGVGEHFEYWGFDKEDIIELDWNENFMLEGAMIYCLPARHFSGRGLSFDKTLWASFMLQTPSYNIYISGDSGYDTHFADIGRQFDKIDFAIIENGQYNEDWRLIHLMPEELINAIKDLNANMVFTVHNSKYALGKHSWNEPLDNIFNAAQKNSINLITPMIGELVYLDNRTQIFKKWWKGID